MKFYFKFGVVVAVVALAIGASAGSMPVSTRPISAIEVHNFAPGASSALTFVGNSNFSGISQSGSGLLFDSRDAAPLTFLPNQMQFDSNSPTVGMPTLSGWKNNQQVPEGGAQLSYLGTAGLALVLGAFIARRHRRRLAQV